MIKSRWVLLGPAILSMLTVAVCAMPGSARLQTLGERELAGTVAGACLGSKADANYCVGTSCSGPRADGKYVEQTGTGTVKK